MQIKGRWRIVEMELWDMDAATGRGWASLAPDGSLEGRIYFHMGDDSSFRAEPERWCKPR